LCADRWLELENEKWAGVRPKEYTTPRPAPVWTFQKLMTQSP
jgi:hypothetical protein